MTETTIDDFTRPRDRVPRRQRRAAQRGEVRVGRRLRQRLDARREDARAGAGRGRRGQGLEAEGVRRRIRLDLRPDRVRRAGPAAAYDRAYRDIVGQYAIPSQSPFGIGLGMVAPTILAHAIPEVRERYLRPLWRGEIIGCQLFSEPVAGSDLAGIQTKAERDGDEWIITGQKVWTSGAQYSDIGEIITRTSPDKPKHKGLSMFLVDMHVPGVEVRPLRQMTGGASFNEVFFEEVRVHDSHRLGDVDEGWTVALTTLMNERAAIGGGGAGVGSMSMTRFIEMARHFGLSQDPLVRQGLAEAYIRTSVARYTNMRAMAKIRAGQLPGPEMSIGKLALTHEHDEGGSARRRDPRAAPGRRHGRVGYVRLLRDGARHPGYAGRRRDRRGHAQHRRRAGAGAAEGAPDLVTSTPCAVVRPFERLRYLARASGEDAETLLEEAADCLAGFGDDPMGVVIACRRLLAYHPTVTPLWWLCAQLLAAPDPAEGAWAAWREWRHDTTPARLAGALPFPHERPVAVARLARRRP